MIDLELRALEGTLGCWSQLHLQLLAPYLLKSISFVFKFSRYTHQSALDPRGGLWPVLFMGNP
jgi:hypothetical protein